MSEIGEKQRKPIRPLDLKSLREARAAFNPGGVQGPIQSLRCALANLPGGKAPSLLDVDPAWGGASHEESALPSAPIPRTPQPVPPPEFGPALTETGEMAIRVLARELGHGDGLDEQPTEVGAPLPFDETADPDDALDSNPRIVQARRVLESMVNTTHLPPSDQLIRHIMTSTAVNFPELLRAFPEAMAKMVDDLIDEAFFDVARTRQSNLQQFVAVKGNPGIEVTRPYEIAFPRRRTRMQEMRFARDRQATDKIRDAVDVPPMLISVMMPDDTPWQVGNVWVKAINFRNYGDRVVDGTHQVLPGFTIELHGPTIEQNNFSKDIGLKPGAGAPPRHTFKVTIDGAADTRSALGDDELMHALAAALVFQVSARKHFEKARR